MKNIVYVSCVMLALIMLSACGSSKEQLKADVEAANKECPMTIDEVTVLSSVSMEGNNFVYNYSIDENYVSVADVEQNKAVLRASIKERLSNPDQLIQKVIEVCKNANAGLSYRYVGDVSGDVSVINFSPSEL